MENYIYLNGFKIVKDHNNNFPKAVSLSFRTLTILFIWLFNTVSNSRDLFKKKIYRNFPVHLTKFKLLKFDWLNAVQDGAAHGRGQKILPKTFYTHPKMMNFDSYTLPKEDPKNINYATDPLSSADVSIFSPEISNFCYIKKYRYRLHFNT